MAVTYDIKAIPTVYRGRQYRSRLEAKWAAFFDLLGWVHEYEPADLGPWSPDFALLTAAGPLYVEVKPISAFCTDTAAKMAKTPGEHVLCGLCPFEANQDGFGYGIGWFVYGAGTAGPDADWAEWTSDPAIAPRKEGAWALTSAYGSYMDRISGFYDGNPGTASDHALMELWTRASNIVQWQPR